MDSGCLPPLKEARVQIEGFSMNAGGVAWRAKAAHAHYITFGLG